METISNEEKAKEIMNKFYGNLMPHYTHNEVFDRCFRARYADILEAMEWKDEQYNEEKRELLGLVKMLKVDEHNQTIIEDLVAILNL